MSDPCLSPWTYEKKVGAGWLYNEPDLLFNDAEFDTFPVYYNSLGLATEWDEVDEISDFTAVWDYELPTGEAWKYNEPEILFNSPIFDGYVVYYNRLGNDTHWTYEQTIDGCVPVPYQFMDSSNFQFMDGTQFDFN